jgi:hypothetical protein
MKYRLKENTVEATVERYRIVYPNGVIGNMGAEEFERDFEPVPEKPQSQTYIVEYRERELPGGDWTKWGRSRNRRGGKVYSTWLEAADTAKYEQEQMNVEYSGRICERQYEYRVRAV